MGIYKLVITQDEDAPETAQVGRFKLTQGIPLFVEGTAAQVEQLKGNDEFIAVKQYDVAPETDINNEPIKVVKL